MFTDMTLLFGYAWDGARRVGNGRIVLPCEEWWDGIRGR
jgi:hypothetical protein